MALFQGDRENGFCVVWLDDAGLRENPPIPDYSPGSFEWGYVGLGPTRLAVAMLLQVTNADTALLLAPAFMAQHVSKFCKERWQMESGVVAQWVADALLAAAACENEGGVFSDEHAKQIIEEQTALRGRNEDS